MASRSVLVPSLNRSDGFAVRFAPSLIRSDGFAVRFAPSLIVRMASLSVLRLR
jgi:hypothetical protein